MRKHTAKALFATAVCAALLTACGGGGGGGGATPPTADETPRTITNVFDFIRNLIANNGENSEPININTLTLATDDKAEPEPLP